MTAKWPVSVATDADLFVAKNALATTLASTITNSDTTISLTNTTNFPVAGGVIIDQEVIFYTGISGSDLTGCVRGSDGTSIAGHNAGVPVSATIIAFHHNGLMAEIEAIETYLWSNAVANPLLGNLAAAGYKITGLGAGSTNGDSLRYEQVIGQFLLLSGGTLTGALTINPVSNQLILGGVSAGYKTTISSTAPAADRTYTIPDAGANASFVMTEGNQEIAGEKTFTAATSIGKSGVQGLLSVYPTAATSGRLRFSASANTGNTTTEVFTAPQAAGRSYTIPDAGANASFVMTEGNQTVNGVKTFGSTIVGASSLNLLLTGGTLTGVTYFPDGTTADPSIAAGSNHGAGMYYVVGSGLRIAQNNKDMIDLTGSNASMRGTPNADSAAAGWIGEYVESGVGTTNFPASGTTGDLTSVSLSAGDWDVTVCVYVTGYNGLAFTEIGVSSTSGNSLAGLTPGTNVAISGPAGNYLTTGVSNFRVNISTTTTYYLKYYASYTGTTPTAQGRISARRVR
jgi:hypothetical protein